MANNINIIKIVELISNSKIRGSFLNHQTIIYLNGSLSNRGMTPWRKLLKTLTAMSQKIEYE